MSIEATQTVGELAANIPGATREFEKLGIDYCCGGNRTLGEACAERPRSRLIRHCRDCKMASQRREPERTATGKASRWPT